MRVCMLHRCPCICACVRLSRSAFSSTRCCLNSNLPGVGRLVGDCQERHTEVAGVRRPLLALILVPGNDLLPRDFLTVGPQGGVRWVGLPGPVPPGGWAFWVPCQRWGFFGLFWPIFGAKRSSFFDPKLTPKVKSGSSVPPTPGGDTPWTCVDLPPPGLPKIPVAAGVGRPGLGPHVRLPCYCAAGERRPAEPGRQQRRAAPRRGCARDPCRSCSDVSSEAPPPSASP